MQIWTLTPYFKNACEESAQRNCVLEESIYLSIYLCFTQPWTMDHGPGQSQANWTQILGSTWPLASPPAWLPPAPGMSKHIWTKAWRNH